MTDAPSTVNPQSSYHAGENASDDLIHRPLETLSHLANSAADSVSGAVHDLAHSDTATHTGDTVNSAGRSIGDFFHKLNWSGISGGLLGMGGAWLLASMFGGGGMLSTIVMLLFLPAGFFLGSQQLAPMLSNLFGGHSNTANARGTPAPAIAPNTPGQVQPVSAQDVYDGGRAAYAASDWRGDPAAPPPSPVFRRSSVAYGSNYYGGYDVPEADFVLDGHRAHVRVDLGGENCDYGRGGYRAYYPYEPRFQARYPDERPFTGHYPEPNQFTGHYPEPHQFTGSYPAPHQFTGSYPVEPHFTPTYPAPANFTGSLPNQTAFDYNANLNRVPGHSRYPTTR